MESSSSEFTIRDIGPVLVRRRWVILGCLLVCVAVGWIVTLRSPRVYASGAKLLFNRPSYAVLVSDTSPTAPTLEDKATQVYLLKSREVAIRAEKILRAQEVDISFKQIAGALKVGDVENTDIIELSAEHTDPELCSKIANAAATAFVSYKRTVRKENVGVGIEVLQGQLEAAERKLRTAERLLSEFKRSNRIFKPEKQIENALTRISSLEAESSLTRTAVEEARKRADLLASNVRQQTQALSTGNIRNDKVVSDLWERLGQKELDILSAEQKYTDKFPGLLPSLRAERAELQKRLEKEVKNIVTRRAGSPEKQGALLDQLAEAQSNLFGMEAKLNVQGQLLSKATQELLNLPAKERELTRLQRAQMVAEQIYTNLLSNLERAQVDKTRQNDSVVIAELASPADPKSPIRPKPKRNLFVSILIGAAIGVFGAFLLEYMDDALRSSEDVKRYLNLPVLGQIPVMPDTYRLISDTHPKSPIAEAYRTLRSNLSFVTIDSPVKSLVVTSSSVSEGKSVTAANLALTMAQEGKRVLLVDADMRHPTQHQLFGIQSPAGLTALLTGEAEPEQAIISVGDTSLGLITGTELPPNPSEMLASQKMSDLMESLRLHWDVIIFDTPPCNLVADAVILASRTDAVLQVIDSETGGRQQAMDTRDSLKTAHASLVGVVLNRIGSSRGRHYYYYHYDEAPRAQLPRPSFLKSKNDGGNGNG